jgi:hypothetical protein
MPCNRHTVEQIITELREAEVAINKGQPVEPEHRTRARRRSASFDVKS